MKITISEKKNPSKVIEVDRGILIAQKKRQMIIEIIGEHTFEELHDLYLSALLHLYESAVHNFGEENRKLIYERSVQMYSLIIDKFYPDGKETRYGILTDEDIKKAEEAKLDVLYKSRKD